MAARRLTGPGVGGQNANVLRIQPPLVISGHDLDRAVELIGAALKTVS